MLYLNPAFGRRMPHDTWRARRSVEMSKFFFFTIASISIGVVGHVAGGEAFGFAATAAVAGFFLGTAVSATAAKKEER